MDLCLFVGADSIDFEEANEEAKYRISEDVEINTKEKKKTWELNILLQGRNAIRVECIKPRGMPTEVQRYKDRLVIEDHKKEESIEYGEVFTLVPN